MRDIDFVIVGAQRAGSTALSDALSNYEGVELPALELPVFEARFFSKIALGELQKYFTGAGPIRGLKRPDYLADPGAPRNLAASFPSTLVVAVLRDPIERFLSAAYWYQYVKLIPPQPMTSILAEIRALGSNSAQAACSGNPYAALLENGRYKTHLARWREYFPAAQLRIFFHDDLRRPETTSEVCVDILSQIGTACPRASPTNKSTRQNAGVYDERRLKFLSHRPTTFRWEDMDRFKYVQSRLLETPVRAVLSRGFHLVDKALLAPRSTSKQPAPLAPKELRYLEDFYRNDLAAVDGIALPDAWKARYRLYNEL